MGKMVDHFTVFGITFLSGAFSVWKVLFHGGIDSCKASVLSPPPNALYITYSLIDSLASPQVNRFLHEILESSSVALQILL